MVLEFFFLHRHQYGFRKKKLTTEAVEALLDKILEGIDKGEYSITIYIDLKKAFDTLENKIKLRLCVIMFNVIDGVY